MPECKCEGAAVLKGWPVAINAACWCFVDIVRLSMGSLLMQTPSLSMAAQNGEHPTNYFPYCTAS